MSETPSQICVVDCGKEWSECECRRQLQYDPMPRTDLALPPRMPEAAQIVALQAALAASQEREQKLQEALVRVEASGDHADALWEARQALARIAAEEAQP